MTTPSPEGPSHSDVEWVSAGIIREIFNDGEYFQKALAQEFVVYLKDDKVLSNPPEGEPVGTRSQILYYYTKEGQPVAIVHQYMRPNGTIGASGKPDPKKLFLADRIIATRG